MHPDDRVPWPESYRSMLLGVACFGGLVAALAILVWASAAWPIVAFGLFVAFAALWLRRHMARRPMLAIEDGHLLCRLEGRSADSGAKLTREVAFALANIETIEREIQPWPGQGGERHYYTVVLRDGSKRGLVPRPAQPTVRAALAAFFERHFPGRVRESRVA